MRLGLWGVVDELLQWIGRGVAELLTRRRGSEAGNAVIGGAVMGAVFGVVWGFALSDFSRSMAVSGGAAIGGLLGACFGVFFGSLVEIVDETIRDVLGSLQSK